MDLQRHTITRVRHVLRRRTLTVSSTELLTPRMRRFGFTAPDLHDFVSASHDDHVKLFFPAVGNQRSDGGWKSFAARCRSPASS
jgi:NADPH-dependent ferric siderophore reductase